MKSNYELANELGLLAIDTVKNSRLQNKILTNLKALFDNKDYRSLPNPHKMDLEQLGMLMHWHSEAKLVILESVKNAISEAKDSGDSNKIIAQKLGLTTQQLTRLMK